MNINSYEIEYAPAFDLNSLEQFFTGLIEELNKTNDFSKL